MNFNETNLNLLGVYIKERYQIMKRRQSGESAPWTSNQILAEWKFTNVFREDDPEANS